VFVANLSVLLRRSKRVCWVVYHLHGKPIRFELNREEPGTGEEIKDVNGQNSPVETFQSVREDNIIKQIVYSGIRLGRRNMLVPFTFRM
jgi:hypothetical protein